jgi:uncharacterized protein (TIGR02646 family)
MIIRRSAAVPVLSRYQRYKPYLREDFLHSCAFCLLHERHLLTNYWSFTVEHFRPKSLRRFRHLRNVYSNLYYACPQCNRFKGTRWPARQTLTRGSGFVDPCAQDPMDHFAFDIEGGIAGRTIAGKYTISHVRLDRKFLVQRRAELIKGVALELRRYAEIQMDRQRVQALSVSEEQKAPLLASFDRRAQDCLLRLRQITHPEPVEL